MTRGLSLEASLERLAQIRRGPVGDAECAELEAFRGDSWEEPASG
jgi:hypothetical protein